MSPYGPLFSNSVDLAVAWVCVSVWVLIGTLVLRKHLAAASSRLEVVCTAAALAVFILLALNLAVFAVGLVFLLWLKIKSAFWMFWQLFYILSVICVFRVLPVFALGLLAWAAIGRAKFAYGKPSLILSLLCLVVLLLAGALYFALYEGFKRATNERASVDAGFALLLAIERHWPGTTEHNCWTADLP